MRKLKLFFACMLMTLLSIGQVWGTEQLAYTLTPASGSNNAYANACDVEINSITWNVTGNSTVQPWRLGGKNLSNVDRTVYSKTPMSDAITKVELKVGAASNITVNSLKLVVASNADFSTVIEEVSQTFAASTTITFAPKSPATEWTSGAYYKFVFNVSVSGNNNKYVEFTEAKFYAEQSGTPDPVSVTGVALDVNSITLEVGATQTLVATIAPNNASDKVVTWTSNDEDVATVDGGVVTAEGVGTATITATTHDGGFTATATVTVSAALPKITINGSATGITTTDGAQNITVGVGSFGGTFKQYSTTALWFTSGTGYIYNKASFGKIRKITVNYKEGGAAAAIQWIKMGNTVMNSYEAASTNGIKYETSTPGTSNTFVVTGDYEYFCLSVSSKNLQATSIVISYEEVKNAVTVATPATGTGTLEVTGAADLSAVSMGSELTVAAAPSATYHGGTVKVVKTGVTPEEDVTSTVYNAGTGKLTMPDYDITVSATFVADAAISVAVADGQTGWGTVKLYNGDPEVVSSGTTFKPGDEFMIEAIPTNTEDYEFVNWTISAGSDITLSAADAININPTLVAGEVSTIFTATFREKSKPYLAVDPASLSFGPIAVSGSQSKTFELSGENLTADASLAITSETVGDAAMFSVAASVAKDGDGVIAENVTVTYNPTAAGTHTATLTITSASAEAKTVTLSGEAKASHAITWSVNGAALSGDALDGVTTSVLDGGNVSTLPTAPANNTLACANTFMGWSRHNWNSTSKTASDYDDLFSVAANAGTIDEPTTFYAVFATVTSGSDQNNNGPSWSRPETTDTYTDGYTFAKSGTSAKTGYYQDNTGTVTLKLYHETTPIFTSRPKSVTLTASIGAGQNNTEFDGYVYAQLLDNEGNGIGNPIQVNSSLTIASASGDTYTPTFDLTGITSAYGVKLYHEKESGRNVRYYSFSLSYVTSGTTTIDYVTKCAAVAVPTFSVDPADGPFNEVQNVTISCATSEAAIYYTTNGSTPSSSSTLYEGPVSVSESMTLKAIAINGADASDVAEAAYELQVATPTISGSTSFVGTTTVTLECETANAAIYYTLDGSTPTNESSLYSTPFTVNETKTVKAIALKSNWTSSAVAEQEFTLLEPLTVTAAIALIPNQDNVVNDQYVYGIVCTPGTSVNSSGQMTYYISADGSETNRLQIYLGKNLNNTAFSSASDLAVGDRVVVFGQLKNYKGTCEMNSGNYLVVKEGPAVATPVFSPDGGGFMGETDVTITCATASNIIYYTTDGTTTPSKSSTLYEGAIHLNATTTIKAIAYVGDDASLVISKTFTLTAPMTVAEALTALDTENPKNNVAVVGIISTAPTSNPNSGRLTYYISDDGSDTDELEVYLGYGLNGASFSASTDLQVGDEVTVFGNLKIHSGSSGDVKEFDAGNRLLAFNRPEVAVSSVAMTESTAEVEVNGTVTLHASVSPDNATNKAITWSVQSGSDKASVADGVVTGVAEGEAVIRAAATADPTKYAECTVTVSAADPTKHVVTFDATVDKTTENTEISITKGDLTIAITEGDGRFNNGTDYRPYKNAVFTVSCTNGNITKIEFTCTSSKPITGFADLEGLDKENEVWTGNAPSVSFTASGAQVQMTQLVITYKEDSRAAAGLAWDPSDDIELTVGDAFSAPALQNPNNIDAAEITIASDNTDLATVSAGVVSLVANATGTATITATFAGNETYKPATVSYTITVTAAPLTDYYEKVTSTDGIVEGTYLIVYEDANVAFNGGLDPLDAASNTIAVTITNDHKIGVTEQTAAATFYIDPTAGTIKAASGKYIGVTSYTNGLSTGTNPYVHTNMSIDESNAVLYIQKAEWNNNQNGKMQLCYNDAQNQNRFRYFKEGSQKAIQLYKLHGEVVKANPNLAWSEESVELTVGGEFTSPTLSHEDGITGTITYSSDKEAVATVNENGVISVVADATGTAHITASYEGDDNYKAATANCTIKVNPAHSIVVDKLSVKFGSVEKDATVDDQTITVTLNSVDNATATLGGDNPEAFSMNPASPAALTASGDITISVASTATAGEYKATITISDDANQAGTKTVNISLTVTDPDAAETAVDTDSKWVAATATDLVDGKQVLITGVKNDVTYAVGEQNDNNRAAVAGTLSEGVFTPGENTMAFTLVAQDGGTFALRTSNGKYLYAATSNKNHLKTQVDVDVNAQWTITTTSAVAAGSSNRNVMQFNSGSTLFSCYANAGGSGMAAIQFYVPKPVTPDPEPEPVVIIDDDAVISDVDAGADVVVQDGGVLTVDAAKTINSIVIEAGGVLALGANTLTADELIIQANGATSSQMTGVVDANPATSTESNVNVGEIYFEKDFVNSGYHWYNVAVPFKVNLDHGIQTADGQELHLDTHFNFYKYNGQTRYENGKGNNWVEETTQLQPGVNYQCVFDKAYRTIRFKKAAGENINNGANITANAYGYDPENPNTNAGWNGIANNGLTYAQATLSGITVIQVLNAAGTAYEAQALEGFVLIVGMPFFVQGAGEFNFLTENGSADLYPTTAPQRTSGTSFDLIAVELNHNGQRVDRLYVSASEDATSTYELGKDVAKFTSNNTAQLWVNNYNEKLCVNDVQLANNQAIYDLGLYAPAAGTYSISAQQVEGATLYVTYNGAIVWNLSLGDYELDLTRGTTTGYGLLLVAQPNQMPTGLDTTEGVAGDAVQKILLNGQLYILRDGHLFDAVGHEMK